MRDSVAFLLFISLIISVFTAFILVLNHDNNQTRRINNDRCSYVAGLAGANEWKLGSYGKCYFNAGGKLHEVEIN